MLRRICILLLAALTALGGLVAATAQEAKKTGNKNQPKRWAVLIGVDDYTELGKLRFADDDQRALAEQLVAAGFPQDQVYLLCDKAQQNRYRPFRENIEKQLQLVLGMAEKDDLLIVSFSGHGVQLEGKSYRLPTEAEWEYACRAGTTTRYWCGDDPEGLAAVANVADATAKAKFPDWNTIRASDGYVFTSPVGSFRPNAFGLYDMHGNACQWCADWYDKHYYAASPPDDPKGHDSGSNRVHRGGSWNNRAGGCRSADRNGIAPGVRASDLGFRVARVGAD